MAVRLFALILFAAAVVTAQEAGGPLAESESDASRSLMVSGLLGVSRVDAGEQVSFQMTLTNGSDRTLNNVLVAHVGGAHVTLRSASWCSGVSWESLTGNQCIVAASLAPNQSTMVSGVLLAAEPLSANITATVDWTGTARGGDPTASVRSRAVTMIGSLTVEDWRVRWMTSTSSWVTAFALPIVVAALGYAFQRRLNKQDQQRKQEEDGRAERAEAWRLMLPVSHEYAVKYYAGLVEAAKSMVKRTGAIVSDQTRPEDVDAAHLEGFYSWLMLHARRRALQQTGAYYFKNHVGELLVPSLFGAYWATFVQEADPTAAGVTTNQQRVHRLLDRVLSDIEIEETRDELLIKLAYERAHGGGSLLELFEWFLARTGRPKVNEALDYLAAYSDVLFFEMNRPYTPWFDGDEKIELAIAPDRLVALFRMLQMPSGPQLSAMRPKVEVYLKEAGISEADIAAAKARVSGP
jgi:hypothetical protein